MLSKVGVAPTGTPSLSATNLCRLTGTILFSLRGYSRPVGYSLPTSIHSSIALCVLVHARNNVPNRGSLKGTNTHRTLVMN